MSAIGIATNHRILKLYNMIKAGELVLRPEFQRKLVWNDSHKESFVNTILLELPFPEIYFADGDINLEKKQGTQLVVDGQQRLDTIRRYIDDKALPESERLVLKDTLRFVELSEERQTKFLDYQVVVRDLGRIDDKTIQEVFKRINSVQYALNAVEVANALYDGEFISAAKSIAESDLFYRLDVFTDLEAVRMKDLDFVLVVMATLEAKGYFAQSKEVEEYIKRFNDDYPQKQGTVEAIMKALELIDVTELAPDSIWFRKSSFFTLVVELAKLLGAGRRFDRLILKRVLTGLDHDIVENRSSDDPRNPYAEYYRYVYQNTQGRIARIKRAELVAPMLSEIAT
jgi:hypothetical protein